MSETLGSIVDKLATVDLKMFQAQEFLYEIRRMSLEEFKEKYQDETQLENLYTIFKKSCDLNFQRNSLIDEFDEKIIEMIKHAIDGDDLSNYLQKKHKTY